MAATPTPAAEVIPAYVHDKATNQWFRIGGTPAHTHAEYVPRTGDADVGPGTLRVVTPVDANDVARYADGVPRFATTVVRDAFYAALPGGAQVGMRCHLLSDGRDYGHSGTGWIPDGAWALFAGSYSPSLPFGTSIVSNNMTFTTSSEGTGGSPYYTVAVDGIRVEHAGTYMKVAAAEFGDSNYTHVKVISEYHPWFIYGTQLTAPFNGLQYVQTVDMVTVTAGTVLKIAVDVSPSSPGVAPRMLLTRVGS